MINNGLYIGQTDNLHERLILHKKHLGAKFTKDNYDFRLAYTEEYETRLESIRREKQLKEWSRAKKEALIVGDLSKLKAL